MIRKVPYSKIKNFVEPLTQKRLQDLSKHDLCRIAYIATMNVYGSRKRIEELENQMNIKDE